MEDQIRFVIGPCAQSKRTKAEPPSQAPSPLGASLPHSHRSPIAKNEIKSGRFCIKRLKIRVIAMNQEIDVSGASVFGTIGRAFLVMVPLVWAL